MNVIAETTVKRLGLKTEKHPNAYRISWVNDTNSVLVQQRCLIKFSLGKNYVDEVWCDVIPMIVCHMLLARPWLYDHKVLYDGYTNTYSFKFKGRKFVLDPLHISEFKTEKEAWPILTIRQFTRAIHEDNMILMLFTREAKQGDNNVPQEMSELLQGFNDVMPAKVPR